MNLKNKKVLVTGACGFIGSHLIEHLLEKGCKVKAFVFYNSFNSWGWLDAIPKKKLSLIEVIAGDIRDHGGVKRAISGSDVVFHLAALIGIPFSYQAPDSYVDTNIKGTLNVLQACKDLKVERLVVTSTSEVYGTARYTPIDEEHPLQGQSPYSASKIGADKIAESFYLSFGLPITVARPFNTYGPRQSARAIIPTVILQTLSSSRQINIGNISPTRDMTYVADTCRGLIEMVKNDKTIGRTINICNGKEISVGDLACLIMKIAGRKKIIATDTCRIRPGKSEVMRLLGDNSLMRSISGWELQYNLEAGLKRTIEWFRKPENLRRYKGDIYNI